MEICDGAAGAQVLTDAVPRRGVLEGAFVLLDTLVGFQDGAGLSELSRAAGLPKATVHRLVEQLAELGAVQRHGQRYFVGRMLARLGGAWQPHPRLRQAAQEPVHTLATLSSAMIVVWVMHDAKARSVISATGTFGDQTPELPLSGDLPPHAAAATVLHATTQPGAEPPSGFSDREWRGIKQRCRDGGVIVDQQEVMPGVSCVAAPVRLADGRAIASVSALTMSKTVPPALGELTRRAAHGISRNLAAR